MKRKIIGIFVCMLLIATGVLPIYGVMSERNLKKSSTVEIPDSYVIENVPYISQGDSYECHFAAVTMIFQYYGINTSFFEVLFNSGVGYSIGYRIIAPCDFYVGAGLSSWTEDRQLLADIYGLKYSHWSSVDESISDELKWQVYWTKVKENISKNIPVTTRIMLENLPYIPNETGLHMILLVGYNQTNNTVCVHDPYANVVNTSLTGTYIYIPIDCIRNSVKYWDYFFEMFEDTSDEPLPKKEAFELAHARNIERMKGDTDAYDKECTKVLWCRIFGINALKCMKHSYNIRNILFYNILDKIRGTDTINLCAFWFYYFFVEKHHVSQYLIEHTDLHPNALFEGEMLDIEAHNWLLLSHTTAKLTSIPFFRIPAKISVIKEIRDIIDVIITIENDIISSTGF